MPQAVQRGESSGEFWRVLRLSFVVLELLEAPWRLPQAPVGFFQVSYVRNAGTRQHLNLCIVVYGVW